jgi:homoserine kinase type II
LAVYTPLSEAEVARFLTGFDLPPLAALEEIREGVENSNFRLVTTEGRFILTLYEKRVDPADLPFFLGLMEHLARGGVACPTPVRDRTGRALHAVGGRPAALVTHLDGGWKHAWSAGDCAEVGAALARLHAAGAGFALDRVNALSVDGWRRLVALTAADADRVAPGLGRLVADAFATLAARWPSDLPRGVIHADLFPDNVFFVGDQLTGLIDFYFACVDHLAYDLAVALNAWAFDATHGFRPDWATAMTRAYIAHRPLDARERACLPLLAQGAALRFLLTRLYDWINTPADALVVRKDPLEYAAKLRFFRDAPDPAAAVGLA